MAEKGEVYRAGRPMLGARLLAAAKLVKPGGTVADIGCDHGKLAVWLAKKGGATRVIAVDNRAMPLAGAKALVRQTSCGHVVDCRLGDGLSALVPGEAQEIIIAGLSGPTIVQLLAGHPWVFSPQVHLVLVPASRHAFLRRWLCENGFAIEAEVPVLEKGRGYSVLSVYYSGDCFAPDTLFCQLGRLPESQDRAALGVYAKARLRDLKKQAKGLCGPALEKHNQLICEVEKCLP